MINYDPKQWWRSIFAFAGTVLPQVMVRVVALAVLTLLLEVIVALAWTDSKQVPVLNPLAHTVMGVVLGLLLVFRTNSSYDRFWEGRKLWGGLVNSSRNLVRGAAAYCPPAESLAGLVAAYVKAVKHNLRGEKDLSALRDHASQEILDQAAAAGNPPTVITFHISAWIQQRLSRGAIDSNLARVLEGHLSTMVDCQGGCERILKTPIPFVYAVHLRHLMAAYLITLPFVLVPLMGWGAPLAAAVVAFGLLGIEEAGVEIEDPFGEDPNDLPLDDLCAVIHRDATTLAAAAKTQI